MLTHQFSNVGSRYRNLVTQTQTLTHALGLQAAQGTITLLIALGMDRGPGVAEQPRPLRKCAGDARDIDM